MRLEIKRTKTFANLGRTKFYYRLVGGNNEVMMSSQPIKHKQSCIDSCMSIKLAFQTADIRIVDKTYE